MEKVREASALLLIAVGIFLGYTDAQLSWPGRVFVVALMISLVWLATSYPADKAESLEDSDND